MARLDAVMVQQGMVPSRQRAKTLIQNGQISVNGKVCTKPAFAVSETDRIAMEGSDIPFVGRGGLKLEHAVQQMQLSLEGMVCLDIGASTGGFTDCMLQHGAAKVYAIDVGHGQLVQSLREDPRVVNWEGTDVRSIAPEQLKQPADFSRRTCLSSRCTMYCPTCCRCCGQGHRAWCSSSPSLKQDGKTSGKTDWCSPPACTCRC